MQKTTEILARRFLLLFVTTALSVEAFTCGRNYTDVVSGLVTSPNHPYLYPNEAKCTWRITSTAGNEIDLVIEHLDNRETSNGVERCFDTLEILRVFPSGRRRYVAAHLCANSVTELSTTEFRVVTNVAGSNTVMIKFTSDYINQLSGFAIRFRIIMPTTTTVLQTTESILTTEQVVTTVRQESSTANDEIPVTLTSQTSSVSPVTSRPTTKITTHQAIEKIKNGTSKVTTLQAIEKVTNGETTRLATVENIAPGSANLESINGSSFLIIGVVLSVILIIFIIAFFFWRKKKGKNKLESDVVFQNLTTNEVQELDEYGRPRENTYVEIPLLPENGDDFNQSNLCRRSSSAESLDSIAAAKLKVALQNKSGSTLLLNNQSPTSDQGASFSTTYTMADENLSPYEFADTGTNNNCSSQFANRTHVPLKSLQRTVPCPPDGVYDTPTSPPCDPPVQSKFVYDTPKSTDLSETSPVVTDFKRNTESRKSDTPCKDDGILVSNGGVTPHEKNESRSSDPDPLDLYVEMKPQ